MESKREYCELCKGEVTFKLQPRAGPGPISPKDLVWIDERGHIKETEPKYRPR